MRSFCWLLVTCLMDLCKYSVSDLNAPSCSKAASLDVTQKKKSTLSESKQAIAQQTEPSN